MVCQRIKAPFSLTWLQQRSANGSEKQIALMAHASYRIAGKVEAKTLYSQYGYIAGNIMLISPLLYQYK